MSVDDTYVQHCVGPSLTACLMLIFASLPFTVHIHVHQHLAMLPAWGHPIHPPSNECTDSLALLRDAAAAGPWLQKSTTHAHCLGKYQSDG